MKYLIAGMLVGFLTMQFVLSADGRERESCECRELRAIRQILLGFGPPSVPPLPTPTGVPDGGPLE